MPETTTPTTPAAPSVKKKQDRRKLKNTIILVVVLLALAVGGFFLFRFLSSTKTVNSSMRTATAALSSIQSSVQGSGSARAKESAAITLSQGGTVRSLFVNAGDTVTKGQPLYSIFSQAAQDAVTSARDSLTAAQEKITTLQKEMANLQKERDHLTVRAPFPGKLVEVSDFTPGLDVPKGAAVATLVNDRKLKLSLYFSYAYENMIHEGQSAQISIPAVMSNFSGTAETVYPVHFISPEGADHFEAVIVFDNPGTLTEGMVASAVLSGGDGAPIYPYAAAKTEYYETRKIVTQASGPMEEANLLRYANVEEGDALLVMGTSTVDAEIRSQNKRIDEAMTSVKDAQDKLTNAEKSLQDFDAVAPIDGTVTSCTLTEGADVKSGDTVITISNTSTMVVSINVDDRNISYVKPGMQIDLTSDYNGSFFTGTVTKIDMSLSGNNMGSGMTSYPVSLEVQNYDGSLLEGMWLQYSFITSQSDDCIVVPMQAVQYVPDVEGNSQSVVFIQRDSRPENALELDLPETEPGMTPTYPPEKEGFYPVPVTTGLSDNYNVEIKSGLEEGETIFVSYYVENAWG